MRVIQYSFYPEFYWHAFDAWYDCGLVFFDSKQLDRDTFLAYIGGGEL